MLAVSYCLFDLEQGNTIDYTYPQSAKFLFKKILQTRVEDYGFPDGSHDSASDMVSFIVYRKEDAGATIVDSHQQPEVMPSEHEEPASVTGAKKAPELIFGAAAYHLKQDASLRRGALQRSIMVLSEVPLFPVAHAACRKFIFPFFDTMINAADKDLPRLFVKELFHSLKSAQSIGTAPVVKTVIKSLGSDASGSPVVGGSLKDVALATTHSITTCKWKDPISHRDDQLQVLSPLQSAPVVEQCSFGASVKELFHWFKDSVSTIHWLLVTRTPILFVGATAAIVSQAVLACIHLLRGFELEPALFAPYATIEHIDKLADKTYYWNLVVGATNAFIIHRDLPCYVKCDITTGLLHFPDGTQRRSSPKPHTSEFSDLLAASRDSNVRECYFRARLERLNREIRYQVSVAHTGVYFHALSRHRNIITDSLVHDCDVLSELYTPVAVESPASFASPSFASPQRPRSNTQTKADNGASFASAASPTLSTVHGVDPASPHSNASMAGKSTEVAVVPTDDRAYSRLVRTIEQFESSANDNIEVPEAQWKWFRFIFRYLVVTVLPESSRPQNEIFEEFQSYKVKPIRQEDDSLHFCGSDTVAALRSQIAVDKNSSMNVGNQYRGTLYMLLDTVCKNNMSALMRPENKKYADRFHVGVCKAYNFPGEVLLLEAACKLSISSPEKPNANVKQAKATVFVSKFFLSFETSAMRTKDRHRNIVPFDVITSISRRKDVSGVRLEISAPGPITGIVDATDMLNAAELYELAKTLWQRQKTIITAVSGMPNLAEMIEPATIGPQELCPLIIPVGLYSSPFTEFVEEIWENQRHYPIVGWSSKLLPSDPPKFSDFSGLNELDKATMECPRGFVWTSEWHLACYEDKLTTDKCMIKLKGEHTFADADSAVEERIEAGSPLNDARQEDVGFLYASHWTASRAFHVKSEVSTVIRRRLWIRTRRLKLSRDFDSADSLERWTKEFSERTSSEYIMGEGAEKGSPASPATVFGWDKIDSSDVEGSPHSGGAPIAVASSKGLPSSLRAHIRERHTDLEDAEGELEKQISGVIPSFSTFDEEGADHEDDDPTPGTDAPANSISAKGGEASSDSLSAPLLPQ